MQLSAPTVTRPPGVKSPSFRVICHSVLTHRGSKPTNCSCESSWAGPCWDMEPGLWDWPAKLRKLVSVSGGLLPHQLLREITVTLRTLRSKSASGLTSKPRLWEQAGQSRHHMWHQYGQGVVKPEATQILDFLSICTLACFLGCWCLSQVNCQVFLWISLCLFPASGPFQLPHTPHILCEHRGWEGTTHQEIQGPDQQDGMLIKLVLLGYWLVTMSDSLWPHGL